MTQADPVLVLGGSSLITRYLLPRMREEAREVALAARTATVPPAGCQLVSFEDVRSGRWRTQDGWSVASLLPLPVLIPLLTSFGRARRIVALGSTSVFSKAKSADAAERAAARTLHDAESALSEWANSQGVPTTLLRPTLVYDGVGDKNIARMVSFVRRWRVLPLARPAWGLRQPIHADDVASAITRALDSNGETYRAFNIAGGEQLTYRAMAERVFRSLDLEPRLLMLPVGLLRFAFSSASELRLIRETAFGGSMFWRMNDDLIYDVTPGLEALGYQPRPFELRLTRE